MSSYDYKILKEDYVHGSQDVLPRLLNLVLEVDGGKEFSYCPASRWQDIKVLPCGVEFLWLKTKRIYLHSFLDSPINLLRCGTVYLGLDKKYALQTRKGKYRLLKRYVKGSDYL